MQDNDLKLTSQPSPLTIVSSSAGSTPSIADDKPVARSRYDTVVLYRLVNTCTWKEACEACNLSTTKWASVQARYLKYSTYFDQLADSQLPQGPQTLVFSTALAKEALSIRVAEYLEYIRQTPLVSKDNPILTIETVKMDLQIVQVIEATLKVGKLLDDPDSPFMRDVTPTQEMI